MTEYQPKSDFLKNAMLAPAERVSVLTKGCCRDFRNT